MGLTHDQQVDIIIEELSHDDWLWVYTPERQLYHICMISEYHTSNDKIDSVCGLSIFSQRRNIIITDDIENVTLPLINICSKCHKEVSKNLSRFNYQRIEILQDTFNSKYDHIKYHMLHLKKRMYYEKDI